MLQGHLRKRRFPRVHVEQPLFVEVLEDRGAQGFSRTRTLGEGGCSFKSPYAIGYLSLMKVSISLSGRVVTADGRAVYQVEQTDGEFEVGVEFLRLSNEDRIHIRQLVTIGVTR
ncbi:MAG TPA: PilZ domain-containing protein [Thermoanaerobaculia bacterium]|nr:PilZ domain-containing protein [Thermoanaerobaculia bacterium]